MAKCIKAHRAETTVT